MENVNALAFAAELSKKFREACDTLRTNGLDPTKNGVTLSYGAMLALCDSIEHLKRERDAAVEDIEQIAKGYGVCFCDYCKYGDDEEECAKRNCNGRRNDFEWRGVQEEA